MRASDGDLSHGDDTSHARRRLVVCPPLAGGHHRSPECCCMKFAVAITDRSAVCCCMKFAVAFNVACGVCGGVVVVVEVVVANGGIKVESERSRQARGVPGVARCQTVRAWFGHESPRITNRRATSFLVMVMN